MSIPFMALAIWILGDEGLRCRLIDPYLPSFYLAGPSARRLTFY
ncbi:MAG: hypothetical protein ABL970_13860 [Nitrospira sp.]